MDILFPRCAGIDVHKRTVVACRIVLTDDGEWLRETRTYGTTSEELLRLSDWLAAGGCTHVGLESTGEFWKPVFNLLEGSFAVWLLNAQHVQAVPGRKTDVRDAEWLAELLRHGLVRPSFIPPREQRELRELTRQRTNFVRERATLVNRVQKVLECTNLKLAAVVSNGVGASGRAILAALLGGEEDAAVLADLAKGKLRKKRDQLERALVGHLAPHHRFLLTELLAQIDGLDETIARFDEEIARRCAADDREALIELLDTIPGIGRAMAELLVAELGVDIPHPRQYPWRSHRPAPRDRDGDRSGASALRADLALAPRRGAGAGRAGLRRPLAPRRGTPHPAGSDLAQWHR